jgi:murein L,D-transpeptidase YafK
MSTGADNKSMPNSAAYDEGYDRIFGKNREPDRGTFVWDKNRQKFVRPEEYQGEVSEQARNAPIMVDRFYEGTTAVVPDEKGKPQVVDIGSRQKHKEHMRRNNLTTIDDYKETFAKKAEERAKFFSEGGDAKERARRKDQLGKAFYEHSKGRKR